MLTWQDFEQADLMGRRIEFITALISEHRGSIPFRIAVDADLYDHRKNVTINNYTRVLQERIKSPIVDITAANNRIASNFFHRLNTQRCAYSLGNGVSFTHKERRLNEDGKPVTVDVVKEQLGDRFDTDLFDWAYKALIHGVAFGFWNLDRLYVFPLTEFAPLWDEQTGALRGGVRFWRLAPSKPMTAVLYTEQGYTVYQTDRNQTGELNLHEAEAQRPYRLSYTRTAADGIEIVGGANYSAIPIVPLWGSRLKQSTLVGMREQIDAYDLIQSGFANDLSDCAKIYWIIQNCGGMTDADLQDFLDRIRIHHVAQVDTASFDGDARSGLSPYTQDVPYNATQVFLQDTRAAIYEAFGALDVHAIAASSTNDHIDAAYQPMDEEADDFEYQIIEAVQQILRLIGIEDTPQFKRNRISNVKETVDAIMMCANMLGRRKALEKNPLVSIDEVDEIMAEDFSDAQKRLTGYGDE